MCRTCLCLISAFPRDRLQYLPLPEASVCLLIKQQELWLGVELLDWWYFILQLTSTEVFWFFPSDNRKSDSYFSEPGPCKRASAFHMPRPRYSEFFAKNNFCRAVYSPWGPLTTLQREGCYTAQCQLLLLRQARSKFSPARQEKGQRGSVSQKCLSSSTPLYLGLLNDHSLLFFSNLHSVTRGTGYFAHTQILKQRPFRPVGCKS